MGHCHLRNENEAFATFERSRLKWETDYQQSLYPNTERLEQEDQEFKVTIGYKHLQGQPRLYETVSKTCNNNAIITVWGFSSVCRVFDMHEALGWIASTT